MDARLDQFTQKMSKTVDTLREEYSNIRAGRANPHLL
ncbi:MAG TPA: ribosome recycling factor, partial [Mobilitalea sp.]|nr:ribosome recycling factor [Mobilitalea sp.]